MLFVAEALRRRRLRKRSIMAGRDLSRRDEDLTDVGAATVLGRGGALRRLNHVIRSSQASGSGR
jgi:hypothetical protein